MQATSLPVVLATEELTPVLANEMTPLLRSHYDEIAFYKDIPLDPDWDGYLRIQATGSLRVFTARAGDALIGYLVFFVNGSLHYHIRCANEDVLFVAKAHRGTRIGIDLIRYAHAALKDEGVTHVFHHCKHAEPINIGPLLKRFIGCEHVDDVWCKRLDKE